MKWEHRCSLEWMRARQRCLTASDVKELLPFTASGRDRKVTDEMRLKVLARKLVTLTEDDCYSIGAAARGHVLEPYAIQMFNERIGNKMGEPLEHWDDQVIKMHSADMALGFSPDATNLPQSRGCGALMFAEPDYIGEVKSYGPERHMLSGYTPKEKLEERWQIASAMAACVTIDKAYLIFFNPDMVKQMFVATYTRADLKEEIIAILKVEYDWLDFLNRKLLTMDHLHLEIGDHDKGIEIARAIEAAQRSVLNP